MAAVTSVARVCTVRLMAPNNGVFYCSLSHCFASSTAGFFSVVLEKRFELHRFIKHELCSSRFEKRTYLSRCLYFDDERYRPRTPNPLRSTRADQRTVAFTFPKRFSKRCLLSNKLVVLLSYATYVCSIIIHILRKFYIEGNYLIRQLSNESSLHGAYLL